MSVLEKFPVAQLETEEQSLIAMLCGGIPVNPQRVQGFLRHYGKQAMGDESIRGTYMMIATQVAGELTDDRNHAATSFYRSALLYFGVIGAVNGPRPDNNRVRSVFTTMAGQDLYDVASMASGRIQHDHGAFCDVAKSLRSFIGTENDSDQMHRLAYVGAGIAHITTLSALGLE